MSNGSRNKDQTISFTGYVIITALFAFCAHHIQPTDDFLRVAKGLSALMAILCFWELLKEAPNIAHNTLLRIRARRPSDNHGSAGFMTVRHTKKLGLYKAAGLFLGACAKTGRPIFYELITHAVTFARTGGGKTINHVITNLLHYAESIFVIDLKGTLALTTMQARRIKHGHDIIIVNPARLFKDRLKEYFCYNPLILVIDAWQKGQSDPETLKDVITKAQGIGLQLIPEAKGDNKYFYNGQRDMVIFLIVYLCTLCSEAEATLSNVLSILRNDRKMNEALATALCHDEILSGDLAEMAEDLLETKHSEDKSGHWQSFKKGATQVLNIYASSGYLAECTSKCDFRFFDLKIKKATLYLIADPNRMEVFGPWLSLLTWCAVQEMVEYETQRPPGKGISRVLFLLDEVSNMRVHGLISRLTELREYGLSMWFFLQSHAAFIKTYSKEDLDILLDQCEFQYYMGIASYKMAELTSKFLGMMTVITEQFQLGNAHSDPVSVSTGEKGRALKTSDEFIQSKKGTLCIVGEPAMEVDNVNYGEIWPLKKWQGQNPFFKKKLKKRTRIKLKYYHNIFTRFKRRTKVTFYRKVRKKCDWNTLPFRLIKLYRILLFVLPLASGYIYIQINGMPHMLWEYNSQGNHRVNCQYVRFNGATYHYVPDCPFIAFIHLHDYQSQP